LPGAHVPWLQQPPLHVCEPEHLVVHVCGPLSHASPLGHSPGPPQPHAVPLRHACPLDELVQSTHDPVDPHASGASPCTHMLAEEQQPPLQGLVCPPHDVEHVRVVPLHA
jgi:hypothetical protein